MRDLTDELLERRAFLEGMIEKLESALVCAPMGSLRVSSGGGKPRYYLRTNKKERNGKYIRKDQMPSAAAIAQRDYNAQALKAAERELEGIDNLLSVWKEGSLEDVYNSLILPRKKLVIPATMTDEEYARIWQEMKYTGKGFRAGDPEIYSNSGQRVRSKSEALLYDMFVDLGVPRRFEYPVRLWNGEMIYPDFTLLNVRERREFCWEHLGKMHDPNYMRRNTDRINDLILSGYIPGYNLILTMESDETPLNINVAKTYVKQFLL